MTRMKSQNGQHDAVLGLDGISSLMGGAALSPLRMTQSLAQEGLRFWARRMHAYAEWADAIATCATPQQFLAAQNAFLAKTQQEYVQEGAAVAEVIASAAKPTNEKSA